MKDRENGIALLFSLVFLSMITLILTALVFTLRTEEMFIDNMERYDSSVAKTKLFEKKAINSLRYPEIERNCLLLGMKNHRYPLRYSYSEPDMENYFDYQRMDETCLEFDFGFNPFVDIANNANGLNWGFVKEDDNIYYRNVFFMVNEGIKFDLNGLLYGLDNELAMMNFYDLEKLLDAYGVGDAKKIAKKLTTKRLNQESEDKRVPWLSWRQIWRRKVFTSDLDYVSLAEEQNAVNSYHALSTHTTASPESYIFNDYKTRNAIQIHRFYLGHFAKMNRSSISDIISTKNIFTHNFYDESFQVKSVVEKMGVLTNQSNKSIPWIGQIKGCLDDIKHDEQIQSQIVANLIDYSDKNYKATTDYSPYRDYNSNKLFSYCGLEKSPYLAKGVITLSAENGEIIPSIGFVLANFYDPANVKVVIKSTLEINGEVVTINETVDNLEVASQSLTKHFVTTLKVQNNITNAVIVTQLVFEIYRDGSLADVSLVKNLGHGQEFILTDDRNYYCSFSFRDPKCNNGIDFEKEEINHYNDLYLDSYNDWKMYKGDRKNLLDYSPDKEGGYPENPVIDREDESNLCSTSTSIIRNGIIRSFWELGAIHRGEPWRTLNLKGAVKFSLNGEVVTQIEKEGEFNKYFSRNLKTGEISTSPLSKYSGLYQHGDVAMLEQVKLSTQAFSYPQISPFSIDKRYWQYLLSVWSDFNCLVKSPFMDAEEEDFYYLVPTELTSHELKQYYENLDNLDWLPVINRETLGALLFEFNTSETLQAKSGSSKNDLYQEELVTKMASDLKTKNCFYRMISTTQKLKKLPVSEAFFNKKKPRNMRKLNYSVDGVRNRGWFLIDYKIKRMSIIKYDNNNHQLIVTRKIEDW